MRSTLMGPILVLGSRGSPTRTSGICLQDHLFHPVIDLPVDVGPLQGGAVLAAVDEGPPHHEAHRLSPGAASLNRIAGGRPLGPAKNSLSK